METCYLSPGSLIYALAVVLMADCIAFTATEILIDLLLVLSNIGLVS